MLPMWLLPALLLADRSRRQAAVHPGAAAHRGERALSAIMNEGAGLAAVAADLGSSCVSVVPYFCAGLFRGSDVCGSATSRAPRN